LQGTKFKKRIVNSAVESYFRWVKNVHRVASAGGRRIRIARFIREQRVVSSRRLNRITRALAQIPPGPAKRIKCQKNIDYRPAHDRRGDGWNRRGSDRQPGKSYFGQSKMPPLLNENLQCNPPSLSSHQSDNESWKSLQSSFEDRKSK